MRRFRFLAPALLLALAVPVAYAQVPPTQPPSEGDDALMRELEAAAGADEEAVKDSRGADATIAADRQAEDPMQMLGVGVTGNELNPAISIILDTLGAYFSDSDRVRQGAPAPTRTGPAIQGLELAISANIDPYFRVDVFHELAHNELEEAFVTTTSLPLNLKLRAGLFRSEIGRLNTRHPHSWDFVLPSLPNQFLFGVEGLGAPGAELSVLLPLPWYVEVIGALQSGEGGAFRTPPAGDPALDEFLYPARLVQFFDLSDDWALMVGATTVQGTSAIAPDAGNRASAYGGDTFLKWRPIGQGETGYRFMKIMAEGWYRVVEVPDDLWRDAGGYTELVFGLSKEWQTGVRIEIWRRLGGDPPTEANARAQFGLDVERASYQLTFLPSHFSKVRLQYTAEHAEMLGPNHIGLVQLEVSAGAHGAHKY